MKNTIILLFVAAIQYGCYSVSSQNDVIYHKYDTIYVERANVFSRIELITNPETIIKNLGKPDTIMLEKQRIVFFNSNDNKKVDSIKQYDIYLFKKLGLTYLVDEQEAILQNVDFRVFDNDFNFDGVTVNNEINNLPLIKKTFHNSYKNREKINSRFLPWIYDRVSNKNTSILKVIFKSDYHSYKEICFYFDKRKLIYIDFEIY